MDGENLEGWAEPPAPSLPSPAMRHAAPSNRAQLQLRMRDPMYAVQLPPRARKERDELAERALLRVYEGEHLRLSLATPADTREHDNKGRE